MGFFDFNHLNVIISWYLLFYVKFEIVAIVFLTHQLFKKNFKYFIPNFVVGKKALSSNLQKNLVGSLFLKVHYTCLFNLFCISKEYICIWLGIPWSDLCFISFMSLLNLLNIALFRVVYSIRFVFTLRYKTSI